MQKELSTILVVDDTETNIDILVELLGNDYDVMVALDGKSAIEIACEEEIELILLDIMMPDMDGYETCEILKSDLKTQNIPVIFITAKIDEDSIEKAYINGGHDYVTKPFKPKELIARIKTQLKLRSLIKHLEYISSYDMLCGIYNRRKFFELGEYKFGNERDDLFVIMIDIDNFKSINDTYGHPLGDEVIKSVTKTISQNLPNDSVFGRLGGEEFSIVYHSESKENVFQESEIMRKEVEKLEVFADNGDIVKFTISAGVVKNNAHIKTFDQILKEADFALYEAKGEGRNKSVFRD